MEGGKTLDQKFFLAANSGQGFFSLYEGFPGKTQFLHIIKGGPGTGKSGFMRRIRRAARDRGLDTVSILCSGDPESLDGLSVPALGQAWVDGTAPHVREPGLFGADADYVNLGQFCRLPLPDTARTRALALNRAYKERYSAAYALLEAAAALGIPRRRQFGRIVLPQAMRSIVPNATNEVIGLVKGTSVLFVIAIPELFYAVQVIYNRNSRVIPLLLVAVVWYAIITTLLSIAQYYIERHYARGTVRVLPPTPLQRARRALAVQWARLGDATPEGARS
jgi:hypothetical protein